MELHESEKELNAALCNFCNGARDPFPPSSEWDDETWRNLGKLSKAYNDWYVWLKKTRGVDPFNAR